MTLKIYEQFLGRTYLLLGKAIPTCYLLEAKNAEPLVKLASSKAHQVVLLESIPLSFLEP